MVNVIRGKRLDREINEELESHLAEAIEQGRDPVEVREAFGAMLRTREECRDQRLVAWLDSLRADAVFGWRQLRKRKASSAAAILSLGLAIGACTAAFRIIDALLLRPLPVAKADRLYVVSRQGIDPGGNSRISQSNEYPLFRQMRTAVKDQAELIAVSYAERMDITFGSDEEMEKVPLQYVSGWMFQSFGLRPALGRLLTEDDDRTPGALPVAVLSHEYWTRRFARDPNVVGRTFRMGNLLYEIAGVVDGPFTGTEPGIGTAVFVPAMMHPGVTRADWSWFRTLAILQPDAGSELVRAKLHALLRAFQQERAKGWTSQTKQFLDRFLNQTVLLEPASSGASGLQRDYRQSLLVLASMVALVLLIACANVANMMTAQASARAREMALRVSIGAGRRRLVQMVLVESAWIGGSAALAGTVFAWWAAPFVVGKISAPNNPTYLLMPMDWRLVGFGLALAILSTFFFGLPPALRASSVAPASALKGGVDPHSRRRLMHALIAVQVAFCFVVHFAAGLFVSTFDRLANQPTGFSAERILVLDTSARRAQAPAVWSQAAEHLRSLPGVEAVSLAHWSLLTGTGWNGFIWVDRTPTEVLSYFLGVSPGWIQTMRMTLIDGRDLRPDEAYPSAAIVNEAFARQCFGGANPIGRWFEKETGNGVTRDRFQVVGLVRDARYRNMREPITPTAYVPFHAVSKGVLQPRSAGAFIVRTSGDKPMAMAATLRREVAQAHPELRVSNIRTQVELNQQHTVRERLLAMLSLFFAAVALLLAGLGLYGVLDYSVLQRRREIGIRLAIGAQASDIVRRVSAGIFLTVIAGSIAGIVLGMASIRYIKSLLYQVEPAALSAVVPPALIILAAVLVAALPAVMRALRIDPVTMLRAD